MKNAIQWILGSLLIAAASVVYVVAIALCIPVCFLWHIVSTIHRFIVAPERTSW